MNETPRQSTNGSPAEKLLYLPRQCGALSLEAEIPKPGDFKSTFVGDTCRRRAQPGRSLSVWVNRCAHRGAMVCRAARGNARSHICAYHQWSYDTRGNLRGVPFRNGVKGLSGMPADFDLKDHAWRSCDVRKRSRHRNQFGQTLAGLGREIVCDS